MMRTRRTRFAATIALLAAVIAVVTLLTRHAPGFMITAEFDQAYGLTPGGLVIAGGVQVGEITSISLGKDRLPHVQMRIDDNYRLRQRATADIRLASNSGELNRYILLTSGSGAPLANGASIPTTQTQEPVEVDQLLGTLDPSTRADVHAVLASLNGSTSGLAKAFRASLRSSSQALSSTADLLGEVSQDGAALQTLVAQGARLAGTLSASRQSLGAAVDELSGLLTLTGGREAQLSATVRLLPGGLTSLQLALDRVRRAVPSLASLVTAARPAVGRLGPALDQLRPTLAVAKPALGEASELFRQSPAQLTALRPIVTDAGPVASLLTYLLPRLLPVLDYARVYTPEIAGVITSWASMVSSFDANGHGVHFGVLEQPIPDRTVGPGDLAPGFLAPPFIRLPGADADAPWWDFQRSFLSKAMRP